MEPISVIFGVIQTTLYIDFAWVYFTRQRVKLRGGSVVDSDDLSKGWLVKRLLGRTAVDAEDDEETGPSFNHQSAPGDGRQKPGAAARKWGPRGISVSADEGVLDGAHVELDDPTEFEDENSDDDTPRKKAPGVNAAAVGNGSEWREERS